MKDDCIFCKLANGILDTNTYYEDDNFRVILDVGPATDGHVLILPKEHYENVYEMPDELVAEAYKLAKKVAIELKDITGCKGINILQNNGEAAGQTVFHYHIHVIPRYGEGEVLQWEPGELKEETIEKLIKK